MENINLLFKDLEMKGKDLNILISFIGKHLLKGEVNRKVIRDFLLRSQKIRLNINLEK